MKRTLAVDTLKNVGKKIKLNGWAASIRDHGGITFVDVRDKTGVVQCVGKDVPPMRPESVVEVRGIVSKRPDHLVNPHLETGRVELKIESVKILSPAASLPFPIDGEGYEIEEKIRNKYRYLDLRRERMARNMKTRSRVTHFMRNWLIEKDFVEIETPILTKSTPEGARDFLVPSRLQPGKFYALPQSPQQYKQLLMVAGFENYFQLARCFRDEDPRSDRAYAEFTQLDMEMSFVEQNDILELTEALFTDLVKEIFPDKRVARSPWPRIPYSEAMEKYGSDKPDLRKNRADKDELAFAWIVDFPLFSEQTKDDFFYGSGRAKYAPSHHMFTAPHPDDVGLLDKNPLKVRGLQHDMVLNGHEVGGGSVRIHQPEIQSKIFELIGFSDEQKSQFEHMLEAFRYGVPPHGGIAPGIDRFIYVALGEPTLREVMAFPTSSSGKTAVLDAPSRVSPEQLRELGIAVVGPGASEKAAKKG
jgi:aspartyl-tRNA synthetase